MARNARARRRFEIPAPVHRGFPMRNLAEKVGLMAVAPSLIPGLDEMVRNGDSRRLADAGRRIAELFLSGVENYRPDHIELFDGVLLDLVPHTELAARADLAERLSLLANA